MSQLKFSNFWLPFAAVGLVAVVIGMQRRNIEEIALQSEKREQQINRVESDRTAKPLSQASSVVSGKVINWKMLGAMMRGGRETAMSRTSLQVRRALLDMSVEELVAQLDEIDALGGSRKQKTELEMLVVRSLLPKAPQLILDRFAWCLRDGNERDLSQMVGLAFNYLLAQDAAVAMAWMDNQVAVGTFESKALDGSDQKRQPFESALIQHCLKHDMEQASKRLKDMAPALRLQVLGRGSHMMAFDGGCERMSKLFQAIEASPTERREVTKEIVGYQLSVTAWDGDGAATVVQTMRTWMQQEAPGEAEKMTGKALGLFGQQKFDDAARLALQYQQSSGNDTALIGFLESGGFKNREAALVLTEKIHDAATRERVRKQIMSAKQKL
jgi:hypothetical protein